MRNVKRSLKSIRYHWKRNVFIMAALLVVMVLLLGMASLKENVKDVVAATGRRIGADLTLRREGATSESFYRRNYYPAESVKEIEKWGEVNAADYISMANAKGVDVKEFPSHYQELSKQSFEDNGLDYYEDKYEGNEEAKAAGEITVIGVSSLEKAWEFKRRGAEVISGRGFDETDADRAVAVVSEMFLRNNPVKKVGDEITLKNVLNPGRTMTAEIIGVHTEAVESDLIAKSTCNYIYVPLEQCLKFNGGDIIQATFHTDAPERCDELAEDMKDLMKQETGGEFTVYEERMMYLAAITPLNGVAKTSRAMFYTVYAILLLILLMLSVRFFSECRKEIGIWISLGEKKRNILTQKVLESALPVLAGMAAGTCIALRMEETVGGWIAGSLGLSGCADFHIAAGYALEMVILTAVFETVVTAVILFRMFRLKGKELL